MEPAPCAKILVIDDNDQNRALARETLQDEGYQVILAENGEAGLRAIEAEWPDCVLLDVRMPGTDGFVQGDRDGVLTRSGRGLGLAFCRPAVEAHGGSIWVEDGNPGAVFCVRLPHAAA